jgi:hypothetical protein
MVGCFSIRKIILLVTTSEKNSTISEEENEERKTKKLPNSMDLSKRWLYHQEATVMAASHER